MKLNLSVNSILLKPGIRFIANLKITVLLFFFIFLNGFTEAQNKNFADSLNKIISAAKEDTARINAWNELARYYSRKDDNKKASENVGLALALAEKIQFKNGIADALVISGTIKWSQSSFIESQTNYEAALLLYKASANKKGECNCYMGIANCYKGLGNFPKALDYNYAALKISEKDNDKKATGNIYNNIGNILKLQGNKTEALKNFMLSLDFKKGIKDFKGLAGTYTNIGSIYKSTGNDSAALKYYFTAVSIDQQYGYREYLATVYVNISNLYDSNRQFDSSNYYQLLSLAINKEINSKIGLAVNYCNLGMTDIKMKNYQQARENLAKAIAVAREIGSKLWLKNAYESLYNLDSRENKYSAAYSDYKLFILYRDSLYNDENTKKSVQTQMQFEFDKKTSADSIRNAEQNKQEVLKHNQEIQQQKIYTYGGAIGFALMLVVAGVSFRAYRNKRTANEIISKQKLLVEKSKKKFSIPFIMQNEFSNHCCPLRNTLKKVWRE